MQLDKEHTSVGTPEPGLPFFSRLFLHVIVGHVIFKTGEVGETVSDTIRLAVSLQSDGPSPSLDSLGAGSKERG